MDVGGHLLLIVLISAGDVDQSQIVTDMVSDALE